MRFKHIFRNEFNAFVVVEERKNMRQTDLAEVPQFLRFNEVISITIAAYTTNYELKKNAD